MKEEWKDVIGYEGLYQVSNYGNVKSLKYGKERVLKQGKNNRGYFQVSLHKESKGKCYLVHRLVSQTFIPNPQNLPFVNHIDENKQNNMVSNLEFCDAKYNNSYGTKPERIGKAKSKPILQFNKQGTKIIGKYDSTRQIERELKINRGNISKCCKGKLKVVGGYRWLYLEDYVNRMEKLYNILKKAG